MKSTTVAIAALLASAAMAQPHHGRHVHQKKDLHKRKYETEWVTETLTATLFIDEHGTSLYEPSPGQFYPSTTSEETTSTSTSTSTSELSEPTTTTTPTPEPEPTTSTSIHVEQEPTTTPEAEYTPPTTTEVPVYTPTTETAEPTSGSGSGGGSSYSGDITFYDIGLGACGVDSAGTTPSGASTGDPAVVALAVTWFTALNSNLDPICNKMIKFTAGGKTGYGRILDRCTGCAHGDIDVNPTAFSGFYGLGEGRMPVTWEFIN